MKTTFEQARKALWALDPARQSADGGMLEVRKAADLEAILNEEMQLPDFMEERFDPRPRISRRTTLSVAGALTVSAVAGVTVFSFGSGTASAEAATPKLLTYKSEGDGLDAKGRLAAIADRAAALPDTAGQGAYDHLRFQQWNEDQVINGAQVTTAVVPQRIEMWVAADGTGTMVRAYGPPQFRDSAQEKAWKQAGSPGIGQAPTTLVLGSGPRMWEDRPPTDPQALAVWLQQGHPAKNGPAETFVAITDLVKAQVLSPAARAAVLRVLGTVPGLLDLGATTDRAGRAADAFGVESDYTGLPTRYTLLVDPKTGAILGYEQTLTKSAGKLKVTVPAVVGYDLYEVAERTDSED